MRDSVGARGTVVRVYRAEAASSEENRRERSTVHVDDVDD
jgi:hypothetical protein